MKTKLITNLTILSLCAATQAYAVDNSQTTTTTTDNNNATITTEATTNNSNAVTTNNNANAVTTTNDNANVVTTTNDPNAVATTTNDNANVVTTTTNNNGNTMKTTTTDTPTNFSTTNRLNRQLTPEEDAKIVSSIDERLKSSTILSKLNIKANSKNGQVTLTGKADSDSQVLAAVEIAQRTVGVADVNTEIEVPASKQPIKDSIITAKIKGLLIREKLFSQKDVAALDTNIETRDGIVYLTGFVDNKNQIDNAIAIIKTVPGVVKVEYSVNKFTPADGNNKEDAAASAQSNQTQTIQEDQTTPQ